MIFIKFCRNIVVDKLVVFSFEMLLVIFFCVIFGLINFCIIFLFFGILLIFVGEVFFFNEGIK